MAFLYEHRCRVPTQDHLCRIGVGVFKVAAACADKARLVLATPAVNCTTHRTRLARVLGGNLHQFITGLTQIYNAFSHVPALAQKELAHMYRKSPVDSACLDNLFQKPHLAEWLRLIANHATFASIDELKNLQRD